MLKKQTIKTILITLTIIIAMLVAQALSGKVKECSRTNGIMTCDGAEVIS